MIALTIVTGFLGAGKTSLINAILALEPFDNPLVLVNEASPSGIDPWLYGESGRRADVALVAGGCGCCEVTDDLVAALIDALVRSDMQVKAGIAAYDHVLLETSGLADPSAMMEAIARSPFLRGLLAPARVLAVADASHLDANLAEFSECRSQLALADAALLTRAGDAGHLPSSVLRIQKYCPAEAVIHTDVDTCYAQRIADWLTQEWAGDWRALPSHSVAHEAGLAHWTFRSDAPVPLAAFRTTVESLMRLAPGMIIRVKGLLATTQPGEYLCVHAVRSTLDQPRLLKSSLPLAGSVIVVFCRGVAPAIIGQFVEAALSIHASGFVLRRNQADQTQELTHIP